jgi:hypothetical protein
MPSSDDIAWLDELEFPYDQAPDLGNLLLKNKDVTTIISDTAKHCKYYVFHGGLPAAKNIIKNREDLQRIGLWLVKIEQKTRTMSFLFVSKAIEFGLIKKVSDSQILSDIADIAGVYTEDVINYGIPAVQPLIKNHQNLVEACFSLAEIAKAVGYVQEIFEVSLPAIIKRGLIKNIADLKFLVEIAQLGGKGYGIVFLVHVDFVQWYFDRLMEGHKPTLKEAIKNI